MYYVNADNDNIRNTKKKEADPQRAKTPSAPFACR